MIKNAGAHWPTNKDQCCLPVAFRIADAAIDPTAAVKYTDDGILDVLDSIAPVN
jgi:hypothetical protein